MTWAYFRALSKQNCHFDVKKGVNFSASPYPTLPAIVPVISRCLNWLSWRWFWSAWRKAPPLEGGCRRPRLSVCSPPLFFCSSLWKFSNPSVLCTFTWPLSCLKKCISSSDFTAHDPHRLPYSGAQYGLCWPLRGLHGTSQGAGGFQGWKWTDAVSWVQQTASLTFTLLLCGECPYL